MDKLLQMHLLILGSIPAALCLTCPFFIDQPLDDYPQELRHKGHRPWSKICSYVRGTALLPSPKLNPLSFQDALLKITTTP